MASYHQRGLFSWQVRWRRGGKQETATLPTEREAEAAKRLIEARRGRISPDEVYAAFVGPIDDGGMPRRQWPSSPAVGSTTTATR